MLDSNSEIEEVLPLRFYLSQNYPNPFKERTTIKYCVAYSTRVKLTVLNSAGEVIKSLVDEEKSPGTYEVEFDAGRLREGNYFYSLEAGDYSNGKKMELRK